MGSFEILFIIAGIVLALPVLVATVDSIAEMVYRVRRHFPSRTPYAAVYVQHTARKH